MIWTESNNTTVAVEVGWVEQSAEKAGQLGNGARTLVEAGKPTEGAGPRCQRPTQLAPHRLRGLPLLQLLIALLRQIKK